MSASIDALQLAIDEPDSTPVASTSQGGNGTPAGPAATPGMAQPIEASRRDATARPTHDSTLADQRPAAPPGARGINRLLTTREVADQLGLSPATVLRRWRKGEIPGYRIDSNVLRFDPEDLAAWLTGKRRATLAPTNRREG